MFDLKDKVVIITGASQGIGRATAYEFAQWGSKVVLAARNAKELEQAQKTIQSSGGQALSIPTDVQVEKQVHQLVQKALETWGRIDVLVNNAGTTHHGPFAEMPLDDIRSMVETNLMGAMFCIKEVLPHFHVFGQGHIVNISSILGKRGVPNQAVYAATKFALVGFSEGLRCEEASRNITVTTFCPSSVSTEMNRLVSLHDHPLKQFIRRQFIYTPEAVARKIVRATRLRQREVVLTLPAKIIVRMNQFCPKLLDFLFAKFEKPTGKVVARQ
jgi:short-subunit dehydrogenase